MKFETILWKSHVPDQYAVSHLRLTIRITEEEEVVTANAEPLLRQLGAPFASFLDRQIRYCLPSMPRAREEGNGEASIGELRDLFGPLHRLNACHRHFHARK